jgi:hypothetical protein
MLVQAKEADMGMLDNMKDQMQNKLGGMDDAMRERLQMLTSKAKEGRLSDSERSELEQLRARYENHDKQ